MIQVPMSEAQFAAATKRLAANGIDLTGNQGIITKDGVTAAYDYADSLLKIEITDRPMFLPLSLIEGRLTSYFHQSIAAGERPGG